MRLRKNQKVVFTSICDFTGQELKKSGVVVSEAYKYIKAHRDLKSEYGGVLKGDAYIVRVKRNSQFEQQTHLVFKENILEVRK